MIGLATLELHGHLREKYGEKFSFDVRSIRQALRALAFQVPEFLDDLKKAENYVLVADDMIVSEELLDFEFGPAHYHVVPVVSGGDFGISAAIALAVATTAIDLGASVAVASFIGLAVSTVAVIGSVLAIGYGVSAALSTNAKRNNKGSQSTTLDSYGFDGVVNTTVQGVPVPVGYGKMIVGGAVVGVRFFSE